MSTLISDLISAGATLASLRQPGVSRHQQRPLTNHPAKSLLTTALPVIALCLLPGSLIADPAIWANAKHVKATYTECGQKRYLIFKGDAVRVPAPPNPPGCRSVEVFYTQLNVAQAFLDGKDGRFFEANVDAGYYSCDGPPPVVNQRGNLVIGTPAEVARAGRENPATPGCTFTREKFEHISSLGGIPFTDVPNGGTMSIRESLALHAKEREKAIAECAASPACQAELRRWNAINAYYSCMKPLQPGESTRVCTRPW